MLITFDTPMCVGVRGGRCHIDYFAAITLAFAIGFADYFGFRRHCHYFHYFDIAITPFHLPSPASALQSAEAVRGAPAFSLLIFMPPLFFAYFHCHITPCAMPPPMPCHYFR
jgi:hypothetical protein